MDLVQRLASVREQTLDRLIRVGLVAVVVGAAGAGAIYYLDRQADSGPSLRERNISAAEDAVRQKPNSVAFRLQLADAYRAANNSDSALEQYEQVLKVDPGQRAGLLGRGEILVSQGKLTEAAQSFNKVIGTSKGGEFAAVDPQLESAYYDLGSVALRQGGAKEAIVDLQRALKVDPTDADALQLLGTAQLKAGAPARAVKAFRKVILLVPTDWCDPYSSLSDAYRALGRGPQAKYASAMGDFCEKKTDDAESELKSLVSGPAAVDSMLGLGMIAEAKSDHANAIRWYRRVLAADPSNSTARIGLNRLGIATRLKPQSAPAPAGHPSTGVAG